MVDDKVIAGMPLGLDEFTNGHKYLNIENTDVIKHKNIEIQDRPYLLSRKHKRIKQ